MEEKIAEVREFIESKAGPSRGIASRSESARSRGPSRPTAPPRPRRALNETISDCLNDGDVRVTVRTWVDVSDPVREDLQKVWHERLVAESDSELDRDMKMAQMDLSGDLKKAHVALLGELQEEWRKLLIAGLTGIGAVDEANATWLAPYALKLAEDPENAAGTSRTYWNDASTTRSGYWRTWVRSPSTPTASRRSSSPSRASPRCIAC